MNILIFGGSGKTGKQIITQALESGHNLTAIVRTPEKFNLMHERLRVVKGDVLNPASYLKEMEGKDIVISTIGVHSRTPTTVYSEGIINIIGGMRTSKVYRLVCVSAHALDITPVLPLWQKLVIKHILHRILKHPFNDMRLMEHVIKNSMLNWTIIRPPMLKDTPLTKNYRIAINEHLKRPIKLSRADLAHYIIAILTNKSTFNKVIEIAK